MALGTWSNPYGALGGGLPNTGDISMFSSKPFGGGNMFGAIAGGLFSLGGSIIGARAQSAAAQAQMDASADQLKNNVMLNREARKGNLAKFIGQNVADYGYGADLDFGRQKKASIFDSTRKRDLERGANIKDFEAMLGMKENPLAREQKQRERKFLLDKITKERTAAMEGMFGPIRRS
jgi:hypothetical protein